MNLYLGKLTYGITLPASTPLSKASAVHRVAFLVLFGEGLVHLIGQTIHDTLVCSRHTQAHTYRYKKTRMSTPQLLHTCSSELLCAHVLQNRSPIKCRGASSLLTFWQVSDYMTCHLSPLHSENSNIIPTLLPQTGEEKEIEGCCRGSVLSI